MSASASLSGRWAHLTGAAAVKHRRQVTSRPGTLRDGGKKTPQGGTFMRIVTRWVRTIVALPLLALALGASRLP